eukprot:174497-Chlamydomonas_euryale.AAC.8
MCHAAKHAWSVSCNVCAMPLSTRGASASTHVPCSKHAWSVSCNARAMPPSMRRASAATHVPDAWQRTAAVLF